jgi:aspartate 1-decarboxylase
MELTLLKSKIHRAVVTGASLDYEGSLTVSADLAELVRLVPYEKILVSNLNNGERFETYAIYGEARRGVIELNGATAHLGKIGDRLTIMSFARYTSEEAARHAPHIAVLNEKNEVVRYEEGDSAPSLRTVGQQAAGQIARASTCSGGSADACSPGSSTAKLSRGFAFPRGRSSEPSLNSIT